MLCKKIKIANTAFILLLLILSGQVVTAQYKSFIVSPKGDTLNVVDKKDRKQGKWVTSVAELRGEPGYDEEGFYKDDKKNGPWRKYSSTGDIIAVENYKAGGKDGVQEYFSFLGDLEKHEEWKGYDPDAPYDTIPIYGQGNNEIISYKTVKAVQYSVPNGEWRYYAPGGKLTKMENYDRGRLMKNGADTSAATAVIKPETPAKTQEILDYEKKYSKKKRKQMERDGQTGL